MSLEYEDESASNSSEDAVTGAARERRARGRGRRGGGRQIEHGNAGDDTNMASDSQMSETTACAGNDMEMSPPHSPHRTLTLTQVFTGAEPHMPMKTRTHSCTHSLPD